MSNSFDNTRPCWIDTIDLEKTSPEVTAMYQQVGAAHNKIHNLYRAFTLQPKPLIAADQHYRDILHNEQNQSEAWLLELLASQVAIIADCQYALSNHGANFKFLLGDDQRGDAMLQAVHENDFDNNALFSKKQAALLRYGDKLCRVPELMDETDIKTLRQTGISDTEILEAVQATACFAYWVRFINALGIQLGNETIGRYGDG